MSPNTFIDIQTKSEMFVRQKYLSNKEKMPAINLKSKDFKIFVQSKYLSQYSLSDKISIAKYRIYEFLKSLSNQEVMISFSGGKDSCVLKHLVHEVQKNMGLPRSKLLVGAEIFHPETSKFIHDFKSECEIFSPIKSFERIIKEDGYPIISKQLAQKIHHIRNTHNHRKYIRAIFGLDGNKYGTLPLCYVHFLDRDLINYEVSHKCCDYIKGKIKKDKRPVFVGTIITESRLRRYIWLRYGCIHYHDGKPSVCCPLSLFTRDEIDKYIDENGIKISNIYKQGYLRSGCICCGFGLQLEEKLKKDKVITRNRFELLFETNREAFYYFFNILKMWKPLADSWISLNINDTKCVDKLNKRKKEVKKWYENIDKNLDKVLDEIEKRNPNLWNKRERKWIFEKYRKANRLV